MIKVLPPHRLIIDDEKIEIVKSLVVDAGAIVIRDSSITNSSTHWARYSIDPDDTIMQLSFLDRKRVQIVGLYVSDRLMNIKLRILHG